MIAALRHGIRRVLDLLGLGADSSALVLDEMRKRALVRYSRGRGTKCMALGAPAHPRLHTVLPPRRADLTEQDVEESIARRAAARAAGDYAAADAERAFLSGKGILIMDGPSGTVWRPGLLDAEVAAPAVK